MSGLVVVINGFKVNGSIMDYREPSDLYLIMPKKTESLKSVHSFGSFVENTKKR